MNVYFWNKQVQNFGDLLTPYLIAKFCGLASLLTQPAQAELIVCGSIMEHMPEDWNGVIAGIGKMHESSEFKLHNARILALRGPLTAKGVKGNFAIGDPGLLADELVRDEDKIYDLGIVPHWTDKTLEQNPTFTKYNPKIIRVTDDPFTVLTQISQCKKIVSSSLHGIILADAFGIPRRTELAPRMISHPHQEGGTFKWRDYNTSVGLPFLTGITQEPNKNKIIDIQHELFDVFEEIYNIFSRGI